MPSPSRHRNTLFISSLGKGFEIIELLAELQRPVALTELTALSGIERSAVQRITHTLTALGYLRQHPGTRAFTLSGKMLTLGNAVLGGHTLRDRAMPYLQALGRDTGETVNLMEREGNEIVYVARIPSPHPVCVNLQVGSRLPLFCASAGRAILSRLDEHVAMAHLAAGPRIAMTTHTKTDLTTLRQLLSKARRLGYALNDQETFIGDLSVAAPIVNCVGEPIAAINVAMPRPRWNVPAVQKHVVPLLLMTAQKINREVSDF